MSVRLADPPSPCLAAEWWMHLAACLLRAAYITASAALISLRSQAMQIGLLAAGLSCAMCGETGDGCTGEMRPPDQDHRAAWPRALIALSHPPPAPIRGGAGAPIWLD
ncbi:uncharacterized protein VTP21DRAFT_6641 [Calcarisporiella thermophila]|uniref:uncharacterized protein n=1 Tax=Calcarisporiella thermophila TaxID=911321 RepID=UPI0037430EBF